MLCKNIVKIYVTGISGTILVMNALTKWLIVAFLQEFIVIFCHIDLLHTKDQDLDSNQQRNLWLGRKSMIDSMNDVCHTQVHMPLVLKSYAKLNLIQRGNFKRTSRVDDFLESLLHSSF